MLGVVMTMLWVDLCKRGIAHILYHTLCDVVCHKPSRRSEQAYPDGALMTSAVGLFLANLPLANPIRSMSSVEALALQSNSTA